MTTKKKKSDTTHGAHLHIRITDEEAAGFQRAAPRVGMTVSAWVRHILREAAGLNKK